MQTANPHQSEISIEYCVQWNYTPRAVSLADELLSHFRDAIAELTLIPSSGGRFEVTVDGNLIFSKRTIGRHAEPGEVMQLVLEKTNLPASEQ